MKELAPAELRQFPEKLITSVAIDFPKVREILVSFPDAWDLISSLRRDDLPLYAAALPWEMEQPRRDHFHGLSAEINLTLYKYRHSKLFEPWPQPVIPVAWDVESGEGKTMRGGWLDVRLQPVADAQTWAGSTFGAASHDTVAQWLIRNVPVQAQDLLFIKVKKEQPAGSSVLASWVWKGTSMPDEEIPVPPANATFLYLPVMSN